jgi:hypothetical protein
MKTKFAALILALVALIFLLIPLLSITRSEKIKKNGIEVEGIVTGTRTGSKGGLRNITVAFNTSDGTEVIANGSKRNYVSRGEKIKFWYDPSDPKKISFGDTIGYNMRGVVIGGLLSLFGFYFFFRLSLKENKNNKMIKSGKKISAESVSVVRNEKYGWGENNPWMIRCKWTDNTNNKDYYFVSKDYTIDPTPFLNGRYSIDVFIDPDDPGNYFMDTSFMPKGNNTIG